MKLSGRRGNTLPGLVVAALLVSTGCASLSPRSRPGTTAAAGEAALEELKSRVMELQRQAAVQEIELSRLRAAVAALEARGTAPAAPRSPAAPPPARPADDPPPQRPAAIEQEDLPVPEVHALATGAAAYQEALERYAQKSYAEAEAQLQRFLDANDGSDLADNALYWIGECRFARGDFRGALTAFGEVATRFPQSNKLADALLKTADTLAALGDLPAARTTYAEVIQRHPGTSAATLAEERRKRLP